MTRGVLNIRRERGLALLETALTLPLVLLVLVGIFEFGRAYQTWQVLTNAAREGARVAVLPGSPPSAAAARVSSYLTSGSIPKPETAIVVVSPVTIDLGGGMTASASKVTVSYPYQFIVLQPIAQLVVRDSKAGAPLTMVASAAMRNE